MYLQAERWVSGYEFRPAEEQKLYKRLVKDFGVAEIVPDHTPSATVSFTVAYWRKANAIHAWFVREVQGGEDDCERYGVDRGKLGDLRLLCSRLLLAQARTPEKVGELVLETLPPTPGFFFGSTEVDEWFWQDMEQTLTQLDRVLKLDDRFEFYYESSW